MAGSTGTTGSTGSTGTTGSTGNTIEPTAPTVVTTPAQVPSLAGTLDNTNSALNQSANMRSSYANYLEKPVDDSETDKAIRQQYVSNIAASDNAVVKSQSSLPLGQQLNNLQTLQSQAQGTIENLNNNQILDADQKQHDIDAATSESQNIQAAINDVADGLEASTAIKPVNLAPPAGAIVPPTPTPTTGPITSVSQIPQVIPPENTSDALAQSQHLRDLQTTYLANPVTDPDTNASIKAGLASAIHSSDSNVMSLARGTTDPKATSEVLGTLSKQAQKSALDVSNSSNTNTLEKSAAKDDAINIQHQYQQAQNQINNTPPVNTTAVNNALGPSGSSNTAGTSTGSGSTGSTGTNSSSSNSSSSAISTTSSNLSSNIASNNITSDGRVRLTPKNPAFLANSTILQPLSQGTGTNGLMFPYTPSIQWTASTNYSTQSTTHANQDYRSYVNTPAISIIISGPFTAQNTTEATYLLGALHFLRTVTKMHFGTDDNGALGLPPPILLLNGYGKYVFNNLPVIIQSFNMEMNNNCNYMTVTVDGTVNQVPVLTNISVTCIVQTTPQFQRTFNWDQFANGTLMKSGGWF